MFFAWVICPSQLDIIKEVPTDKRQTGIVDISFYYGLLHLLILMEKYKVRKHIRHE